MTVRADCRHYLLRTPSGGDAVLRCRVGANEDSPFACPAGCVFFEPRTLSGAGWAQAQAEPMTNTAHGLIDLPSPKRRDPKGGGKKKRRR